MLLASRFAVLLCGVCLPCRTCGCSLLAAAVSLSNVSMKAFAASSVQLLEHDIRRARWITSAGVHGGARVTRGQLRKLYVDDSRATDEVRQLAKAQRRGPHGLLLASAHAPAALLALAAPPICTRSGLCPHPRPQPGLFPQPHRALHPQPQRPSCGRQTSWRCCIQGRWLPGPAGD